MGHSGFRLWGDTASRAISALDLSGAIYIKIPTLKLGERSRSLAVAFAHIYVCVCVCVEGRNGPPLPGGDDTVYGCGCPIRIRGKSRKSVRESLPCGDVMATGIS